MISLNWLKTAARYAFIFVLLFGPAFIGINYLANHWPTHQNLAPKVTVGCTIEHEISDAPITSVWVEGGGLPTPAWISIRDLSGFGASSSADKGAKYGMGSGNLFPGIYLVEAREDPGTFADPDGGRLIYIKPVFVSPCN